MKLPEYDNRPAAPYNPADEGDWPILKGLFWAGAGIAGLALILYNTVDAVRNLF